MIGLLGRGSWAWRQKRGVMNMGQQGVDVGVGEGKRGTRGDKIETRGGEKEEGEEEGDGLKARTHMRKA